MNVMTVALFDLLPGDVLDEVPTLIVKNVDVFGSFAIVDFTDDTSTAPILNGLVVIRREAKQSE